MSHYVWRWSLDQIEDPNGNKIFFTYNEVPANGEVYLSKIEYNNDRKRAVTFTYGGRSDAYKVFEQGSEILETRLLKEIRVTLNGSLVRKYVLSHILNESQNKSLLKSITQHGNDGATALPPITFDYHTPVKTFNPVTTWTTPDNQWIRRNDHKSNQIVDTFDVTGDGRPDLVKSDDGPDRWIIYQNETNRFSDPDNRVEWPTWFGEIRDIHNDYEDGFPTKSAPMDFNRDGYIDIIHANGDNELGVNLNTGNGFSGVRWYPLPADDLWIRKVQDPGDDPFDPDSPHVEQEFTDINGDGRPDIVRRKNEHQWQIWVNTGACDNNPNATNCFASYGIWQVNHSDGFLEEVEDDNDVRVMMADMNGDGLTDILAGNNTNDHWYVNLNTGSGFLPAADWTPPGLGDEDIIEIDKHDNPAKATNVSRTLKDINGDGLPDVVNATHGDTWDVYFNKGNGFTGVVKWNKANFPYDTDDVQDNTYDDDDIEKESRVRRDLMDLNGDGLPDIVNRRGDGKWDVYFNAYAHADLLIEIRDMLGGTIDITYTSSMNYDHARLPFNYWVVTSVTTNNGMTGPHAQISTRRFTYSGGLYDFPTREFRGFRTVTETLPDNSKVIHRFHQDEARKGKEDRYDVRDASNAPFAAVDNTWNTAFANGVHKTLLDTQKSYAYDGVAANPKVTQVEYRGYDNYGNVLLQVDHGDTATVSDDLYTYNEYYPACAGDTWIVDKIKQTTVKASAHGPTLREARFVYDNYPYCAYRGNLTSEEHVLDTGENPETTHKYDEYGNRIMTIDPEGGMTRIEYDTEYHTFPEKFYNAKNHMISKEFDPASGNPVSETDPNGNTTQYVYDALHRKVKEIRPYDSGAYSTTLIQYFLDGTAPEGVKTSRREVSGTGGTLDTFQYVDGMGNLIQTKTEHEQPGKWITADVFYDKMGRVSAQSNPYESGTSAYGVNQSAASTRYGYDILGRPTLITNPDDTTIRRAFSHSSSDWIVTEWDENEHAKEYHFDARQRLVSVTENNMGEQYHTYYEYLPTGELNKITDHEQNITRIFYDSLGRKTRMQDPDMGDWEYGYDGNGNLVEQTDARNINISIFYDKLNRKTLVDYPNDKDITYIYDVDTIGTLSQINDQLGYVRYEYDARLRKTAEERKIDDHLFLTEYDYDAMDRVRSQKYPNGETVNYTYNAQGALESIPGVVTALDYNVSGQVIRKTYANGITTTYDYDPDNNRLKRIFASGIQDFQYSYDNVGNIMKIVDAIDGLTENFTYDDLDRLITAGDAEYSATYSYNAIGNMESETFNGRQIGYAYGENAGPHAVTGKTTPVPVVGAFTLADGSLYTVSATVTLNNVAYGSPTQYMASENGDFSGAAWKPYTDSLLFNLSSGYGLKTVYFKVKNADGESEVKSDAIEYLYNTDSDDIPDKYDDDDDDNDLIPDTWEIEHDMNPLDPADAQSDIDGDSLNALGEYTHGTDLNNPDTDGDGWKDYDEVYIHNTSPILKDTDGDGYMDNEDPKVTTPNHYPESDSHAVTLGNFNEGGAERQSAGYILQDTIGRLFRGELVMNIDTVHVAAVIGNTGGSVQLPDGNAFIGIPPGVLQNDLWITITKIESPNAPPANGGFVLIGYAYEFIAQNSDGEIITQFEEPIEITLEYFPGSLGLVNEQDLAIHYYDEATQQWVAMASVVDPVTHTVTTTTTHFTEFSIMGPKPANHKPVITSTPVTKAELNENYVYPIIAQDEDGDELTYTLVDHPTGMTVKENGRIYWTPNDSQSGVNYVEVHVSDGYALAKQNYYIIITPLEDLNMSDVIRCLKILVGAETDGGVSERTDLTKDDKVGMDDIVYMMQVIAGLRDK
jgi:YD repeat-containing protein